MTIQTTSLSRRTPAGLRAFVGSQHMRVLRYPDRVDQVTPSDRDYWRFLVRRQALEGRCVHYQTYDASGDENDWNINIAPDPAYSWLLDPNILYALSMSSGAPSVVDPGEIKDYDGVRAIECELTPDNGLYDKFESAGLPITSGGWWPDQDEQQGLGPTGQRVGVYGVFAGDYGHGGRPEIHPFDAFWRRFHEPRSTTISWDLGVFQDDSNRFNNDWSRAPIDIEFRVPFCVDVPVTLRTTVTRQVVFTLRRSAFCSVVAKNTRATGSDNLIETFLAPTVRFNPGLRNRLDVAVRDETGVSGRPFALGLGDLTYTSARRLAPLSGQAWLAGSIVIRVAVNQDGFAYWNLAGPNSRTAADVPDDGVIAEPDDVINQILAARSRRRPVRLNVTEARAVPTANSATGLEAEVRVERVDGRDGQSQTRAVTVRPREVPLLTDEASGEAIELDSFDLFATAAVETSGQSTHRREVDIGPLITRLAGVERIGRQLPSSRATIEVDDFVIVDVASRYAPYRRGEVAGEERSILSEAMTRAHSGSVTDIRADLRLTRADGSVRRQRIGDRTGANDVRVEIEPNRQRLVIGPLGAEPTSVTVDATVADRFGLQATTRAAVQNFRVIDARSWVEQAVGISLAQLRAWSDELERSAVASPTHSAWASAAMLRVLVDVLEVIDREQAVPAGRVAGAVALATRIGEISRGVASLMT